MLPSPKKLDNLAIRAEMKLRKINIWLFEEQCEFAEVGRGMDGSITWVGSMRREDYWIRFN